MLNEEKTSCFDEILLAVSKFPEQEQNICKMLAVNPATSATILASVYSHGTASEDVASIQDGSRKV